MTDKAAKSCLKCRHFPVCKIMDACKKTKSAIIPEELMEVCEQNAKLCDYYELYWELFGRGGAT